MKNTHLLTWGATALAVAGSSCSTLLAQNSDNHPADTGAYVGVQGGIGEAGEAYTDADSEKDASYDDGAADEISQWDEMFSMALRAGIRYDDNIFLTNANEESDVIFTIAATLRLANDEDSANTWSVAYTPSYNIYADNSNLNSFNHALNFAINKRLPKTQLGFNFSFAETSGSDRFVSGQVDKINYTAGFNVSHVLTGKSRLDLRADYVNNDYDSASLNDVARYQVRLAYQYELTGKITLGPYVEYGASDVDNGPDHKHHGLGLKADYQATGKTAITGLVGFEDRSFSGVGAVGDKGSTTYEIGLRHKLSGKTSLNAMLYNRVRASYNLTSRGYEATGISLGASHSLSERINLHANLQYEQNEYFRTSTGVAVASLDANYYSLRVGVNYKLPNEMQLGLNLTYRENDSDSNVRDFENFFMQFEATYFF